MLAKQEVFLLHVGMNLFEGIFSCEFAHCFIASDALAEFQWQAARNFVFVFIVREKFEVFMTSFEDAFQVLVVGTNGLPHQFGKSGAAEINLRTEEV